MGLPDVLILAYAVIACWALVMTHAEQQAKGVALPARLAGYAACLAWPAVLVFALAALARQFGTVSPALPRVDIAQPARR